MTEQEKNEIISSVRSRMTGDLSEDMVLLDTEIRKLSKSEENREVTEELFRMAQNLISPEQREYLQRTLYIGERRLNRVYAEAEKLMTKQEFKKAIVLTKQLYEHIKKEFPETEKERFFSFRNVLESNLYYQLYNPTKTLLQTPFDFSLYIGAYAYNLIELKQATEAISVLEEAIRYNPVNPDPRFELAEAYKLLSKPDDLLTAIKETLPVCTTKYALGRCYANMGYYCVDIKDYDSAVCFYYESMIFHDHPAIPGELIHIGQLTGKELAPPTREQVMDAFKKYDIPHGPCREMFHVVTSLAAQAQEQKKWDEAVFYMHLIYDLTNDPKAAEDLKHCIEEQKKAEEEKA